MARVRALTSPPARAPALARTPVHALDGGRPWWHSCPIPVRELEAAEVQAPGAEQVTAPPVPDAVPGFAGPGVGPSAFTAAGILGLQRTAGNGSVARLLARAAAARLDRCPDCGGTCECDEEEEAAGGLAAVRGAGRTGKTLGGETEYGGAEPGASPLVELDPSAGVPDTPDTGEATAGTEVAVERPPEMPATVEDVETEVIDETPSDELEDDDGPEPEADETPETEAETGSETGTLATKPARNGRPAPPVDEEAAMADLAKCGVKASTNMTAAAAASIPLGAGTYGLTWPEAVDVKITACRSGATWSPGVIKLTGRYSLQIRLLPGQSEVTGPKGNTTAANFCSQVIGLTTLGNTAGNTWYMLKAVKRHEQQHKKHFIPALKKAKKAIVTALEAVTIAHTAGMTKSSAVTALKADAAFQAAVTGAQALWLAEILTLAAADHNPGGVTDKAEHRVVDPMVKAICKTAKAKKWAACASCPP